MKDNTLKKVLKLKKRGNEINWVFIPGGAGIEPNCFDQLIKNFKTDSTIWYFKFSATNESYNKNIQNWKKEIQLITQKLKNVIIFTHSFSGMLVLDIPQLDKKLRGLVLCSTSPNNAWKKNVSNFVFQKTKQHILEEKKYLIKKTNSGLKKLWINWLPYYFKHSNSRVGLRFLRKLTHSYKVYEIGLIFLSSYKSKWFPKNTPTLIMSGGDDNLTPLELFSGFEKALKLNGTLKKIPAAGHFPWVDQPTRLAQELLTFEGSIK